MVKKAQIYNPSPWEDETTRLKVNNHPGLYSKTLFHKKEKQCNDATVYYCGAEVFNPAPLRTIMLGDVPP